MSAQKLIEVANAKGYTIGRERSGLYYYTYVRDGVAPTKRFAGNWSDFAKFVQTL